MASVTLDGVSKRYARDGAAAVDGVDLKIASGEFFTLLGPSGCGKTTTLRMVAGFVFPSDGRVLIDDQDVTGAPPNRRDTGMVFQNYALFPHMDVAGNVGFGLRVRRVARSEVQARIEAALELVQLSGLARRRVEQLSGGQQQRVALARALVIRPSVLLLDEPLSNLDAKLREETRVELRRIQREAATTALYVTHDQGEAMAMSDRIAVLSEGRVHQVGTPDEIYGRPATAFVARFIGRSNLVRAAVKHRLGGGVAVELLGGLVAELGEDQVASPAAVAGDTVLVALRPEHLDLMAPDEPGAARGTVVSSEFTGASREYQLDVAGERVWALAPGSRPAAETGSAVGVRPQPGAAWAVES